MRERSLRMGAGTPRHVIDLVLRKGSHLVIVDHKTGKNFKEQDSMRLASHPTFPACVANTI